MNFTRWRIRSFVVDLAGVAIGCGAAEGGRLGREPLECAKKRIFKLRSSDCYLPMWKINVAAPQLYVPGSRQPAVSPQAIDHRCSAANHSETTKSTDAPFTQLKMRLIKFNQSSSIAQSEVKLQISCRDCCR